MKITGIRTQVVNARLRNWIFVRVETDQPGLTGLGEATLEFQTRAVAGAVEDLAGLIIGEDPRNTEHLMCLGPAIGTPSPLPARTGDGVGYSAEHLVA